MKRRYVLITLLAAVIVTSRPVYGTCDATWTSEISTTGCPNLFKSQLFTITWSDSNTSEVSNVGTGECCGVVTTTECWPTFDQPNQYTIVISGSLHDEWSQTVYDRQCSVVNGCSNKGSPKTVVRTHPCSGSGGGGGGGGSESACDTDFDCYLLGCSECNCVFGQCSQDTPILIDLNGDGFELTDAPRGVNFDLNGDHFAGRVAWTAAGSDDGWLVLDRNANGLIDSGLELFGNNSPQPPSPSANGFIALAEFDKPSNGGNGDGRIDEQDAVFNSLRIWLDANHNGVSEASELKTLLTVGLSAIDLDYKQAGRRDRNGNLFRYRAKVTDTRGEQLGRWAWDVILVSGR